MQRNTLFIVIDQLRFDALFGELGSVLAAPALRALAARSAVFAQHFTATVPCGPSRASLLTGLRPERHGAWRNGVPMQRGTPNLAQLARRQGVEPLLFGYTDNQPHPADHHANDPDLAIYENCMPGFRELCEMRLENGFEWPGFLAQQGYAVPRPLPQRWFDLYRPQGDALGGPALYRAEHSDTAYLTDRVLRSLEIRRDRPWFAHVTYIRPHPPLVAPDPWHRLVDPADVRLPEAAGAEHPFLDAWRAAPAEASGLFWGFDGKPDSLSEAQIRLLRATYLGLVAEVDHHVGRLLQWLDDTGQADDTLVVLTADHGEMLGDWGLWGKRNPFEASWRVPLMIAGPGVEAGRLDALSCSVDIVPTLLEWLGDGADHNFDGRSLWPLLRGRREAPQRELSLSFSLGRGDDPLVATMGLRNPEARVDIRVDAERWRVDFGDGVAALELPRLP